MQNPGVRAAVAAMGNDARNTMPEELVKITNELTEAERLQRKEDEEMRRISGSDDEGGGMKEDDFKSLLQNHKMTVAYSEVSAISMLNEMIHAMYWLGVTFEYEGVRLSHLGQMKATNGAVFYKSVLWCT